MVQSDCGSLPPTAPRHARDCDTRIDRVAQVIPHSNREPGLQRRVTLGMFVIACVGWIMIAVSGGDSSAMWVYGF